MGILLKKIKERNLLVIILLDMCINYRLIKLMVEEVV